MMELQLLSKEKPIDDIERLGELFMKSQMFGVQSESQGAMLALMCMSEKMTPTQLLKSYHVVKGRLSKRADAMFAEFRSKGAKVKVITYDFESTKIEVTFEGQTTTWETTWPMMEKEEIPWTVDKQGKRVLKDNWATPYARRQMLWSRTVTECVRRLCPEIIAGVVTDDEAKDMPSQTSGESLNMGEAKTVVVEARPATPTSTPAPAKPAATVVDAVVVDPAPTPTAAAAPTPQPAQAAQPAPAAAQSPPGGQDKATLLVEFQSVVEAAGFGNRVVDYLVASGLLGMGQPVHMIKEKTLAKMLSRKEAMLKSIEDWVKANPATT